MDLKKIQVRLVHKTEESRYKEMMNNHHYLGFCPKIGETLWYVVTHENFWISLLSFSASALKCGKRDEWIGWDYSLRFSRLKLIVNNSRFLILPNYRIPNLGSRILSLVLKRISDDWKKLYGHPILIVETFVDADKFIGTVYKASGWLLIGETKGFTRKRPAYCYNGNKKLIFIKELKQNSRRILSLPFLNQQYKVGKAKMHLRAEHMWALPDFFEDINDPRTNKGKRHSLKTVLAIATAATLCGMDGYKSMYDWAKSLGQKARIRFGCYYNKEGKYVVPSEYIIRNVLIRVNPDELDQAFQRWNEVHAVNDESLAIDGKTMKNAIDEDGKQVHIMNAVGHQSKNCYTQKK